MRKSLPSSQRISHYQKWGETFSDSTIAAAILDRLVHHSTIIKITGKSYRLKGKIDSTERASKTINDDRSS